MIRNVLVGFDGSRGSVVALRWAAWFAAATRCRLHVVNAWQHGARLDGPPSAAAASRGSDVEGEIESRLVHLVEGELDGRGIAAECRLLRGTPVHALTMEAARIDASLLVVGARGAGGALRRLLGSVSRELTECPTRVVAVVPDHDLDEPGQDWTILVGVDGSAGASRALRWAANVARRGGAEVVAVHAFVSPVPDVSRRENASLAAELRQRFEEEWCAPLRIEEVRHRAVFQKGPAAEVIRHSGETERPACVVLGSRGLGPISQRLLGSVTHNLLRDLDYTTVVVPAPRDCVVWKA